MRDVTLKWADGRIEVKRMDFDHLPDVVVVRQPEITVSFRTDPMAWAKWKGREIYFRKVELVDAASGVKAIVYQEASRANVE